MRRRRRESVAFRAVASIALAGFDLDLDSHYVPWILCERGTKQKSSGPSGNRIAMAQ